MEESILGITGEMYDRLKRLMLCERFGSPPRSLRENRSDSVLIGKATKEQQAIVLLYNQINATHIRMHKTDKLPFGVNPHVNSDHYRNHVILPVLWEMLQWSVHRTYPDKHTNLRLRFDAEWNMFALPRPPARKQRKLTDTDRTIIRERLVYGTTPDYDQARDVLAAELGLTNHQVSTVSEYWTRRSILDDPAPRT